MIKYSPTYLNDIILTVIITLIASFITNNITSFNAIKYNEIIVASLSLFLIVFYYYRKIKDESNIASTEEKRDQGKNDPELVFILRNAERKEIEDITDTQIKAITNTQIKEHFITKSRFTFNRNIIIASLVLFFIASGFNIYHNLLKEKKEIEKEKFLLNVQNEIDKLKESKTKFEQTVHTISTKFNDIDSTLNSFSNLNKEIDEQLENIESLLLKISSSD